MIKFDALIAVIMEDLTFWAQQYLRKLENINCSFHSLLCHWMETNGHLHVTTAFSLCKKAPRYLLYKGLLWLPIQGVS